MSTRIIDRGRGPEVEGTRVTVYRIMDYLREGSSSERIAAELSLTVDQVQAVLTFIGMHRREVEEEYDRIVQRTRQPNPAWIEAERPITADELRQRILARRSKDLSHADPGGQ